MQPLGLLLGPLDSQDVEWEWEQRLSVWAAKGPWALKPTAWSLLPCKVGEALPGEVPPPPALLTEAWWAVSLLSRPKTQRVPGNLPGGSRPKLFSHSFPFIWFSISQMVVSGGKRRASTCLLVPNWVISAPDLLSSNLLEGLGKTEAWPDQVAQPHLGHWPSLARTGWPRKFPGSPVVRTLCFQSQRHRFHHWGRN